MERDPVVILPFPSEERARLRVITAGDVGNVHSRLGVSGFEVLAVVDTEAELVIAVSEAEPDAILVEADLCESLEHVHALAPDAAVIVVGDRTPAGALGHIDRGVSATVLAGLLHALAGGGASAMVAVPGFTPFVAPTPAPVRLPRSAVQALAGGAAATTVAVSIAVSVMLGDGSTTRDRPAEANVAPAPIAPGSPGPIDTARPEPTAHSQENRSPATTHPGRTDGSRSDGPTPAPAADDPPDAPEPPDPTDAPEPPGQPPQGEPSSDRPPGHAYGWEHKPPKQDDQGQHEGWSKGKGPGDNGRH